MADRKLDVTIQAKGRSAVQRVLKGMVSDTEKAARETAKAQAKAEREAARATAKAEAEKRRERAKSEREAKQQATKEARDVAKTEAQKRRDVAKTEAEAKRDRQRAAAESKRIAERAARDRIKLERHVQQQLVRSLRDLGRFQAREEQRTQRQRIRDAQRAERELRRVQQREAQGRVDRRQRFVRRGLTGLGAIAGGGAAALGVASSAQGTLGIRSQQELISASIDPRLEFIRTALASGITDQNQRDQVFNQAIDIGARTGLGPEQILSAISANQELFSGLGNAVEQGPEAVSAFMSSIENMGHVALASGAELSDVVTAAGEFQRQLGLSTSETNDALAILAQGAQDGSLNMRDFAETFPQALSQLATLRGTEGRGIGAVREFQALAQGLKAGGASAETARTLQENLLNQLGNAKTRQRIERAGVRVMEEERDAEGNVVRDDRGRAVMRMRNTADILREMSLDSDFQGARLGSVFTDAQARQAAAILIQQEQRAARGEAGAMSLSARQDASVEGGRALIANTNEALMGDAAGQALRMRAEREAAVFRDSEKLLEAFEGVAGPLTDLQDKFPLLTQAVEGLTTVIGGIGIGSIAAGALPRLLGGTAAAAAGAEAAAVGAGAAGAAGAGAAGAGAAGTVLPVAAAGLAGFGIGTWLNSEFGLSDKLESGLSWLTNNGSGGERIQSFRGLTDPNATPSTPPTSGGSRGEAAPAEGAAQATRDMERTLVEEQRNTRRVLERIERNGRGGGGATTADL